MIVLLLLLASMAADVLALRWMLRHQWTTCPRTGLWLVHALLAGLLGGLLWLVPLVVLSVQHLHLDASHLLHACLVRVVNAAEHPEALLLAGVGVVAVALLLRLALATLRHLGREAGRRRAHRSLLDLVADRPRSVEADGDVPLRTLPGAAPVAYCVPGHGGRIVLSTAARELLTTAELSAVVAHERAHLSGRHHWLLLPLQVLALVLPSCSGVRRVQALVARLVEMAADDRACRTVSRTSLVSALLKLGLAGPAPSPASALSLSGAAVTARVHRLVEPRRPLRGGWALALLSAAPVLVAPWLAAGLPAGAALSGSCLV